MTLFRILLVIIFVGVTGYTVPVIAQEGWNLFSVFFSDIFAVSWLGQFDLDFMCMLVLSALWIMWRHHFAAIGLFLGLCTSLLGSPFLAIYLLIASFRANGDMIEILIGAQRVVHYRA